MDPVETALFWQVGAALGIGFLIGLERGWHLREAAEGSRIAGLRTFSLIGLLGGLAAALAPWAGDWLVPAGLLGIVLLLTAARLSAREEGEEDRGVTTLVAALLTYLLGAAAGFGQVDLAVAGGVVVALLLGVKAPLHRLLLRLDQAEILAVLKLLVMTLVLLPVLPDRGFGPWDALNPYRIWWMVVLVAGLSSAGYFAMRLFGAQLGLAVTALFGGLASSTAATLALSRRAHDNPAQATLFAGAALLAGAVMAPRLAVIVAVVAPALLPVLAWPLAALCLALLIVAGLFWWRERRSAKGATLELGNPFELGTALKIGLLLAVILLASEALPRWLGQAGLFALAAVAGLADVDAVTLSYGERVEGGQLAAGLASWAILTAIGVNAVAKSAIGWTLGGRALGLRLLAGHLLSIAAAAAALAAAG